jgi:hypothetical protein
MKINIPYRIYEQIQFFVDRSSIECSGLGKIVVTPDGYTVTEVVLLKQENTSTHTEIDASAIGKALFDLRNNPGGLYFWWHSHVNMDVFWSKTDRDTIEEIGRNGLCVAVVFNKKREKRGAVWLKETALSPALYFDDIPVSIVHEGASEETKKQWAAEFDEKCKPVPIARYLPEYGNGYPLSNGGDSAGSGYTPSYDIDSFENALNAEELVSITNEGNTIMYGLTIKEVDEALERIIATIKGSKAKKKDKRGAIMEYKEMALEQKNYIRKEALKMEEMENGVRYDKFDA